MCVAQQQPSSVTAALDAISAGLAFLNAVDAADLPTSVQADCLKALARAESAHTAAQASVLAAFSAQDGCEDDGQHTARAWLKWQTQDHGRRGRRAGRLGQAAGPAPGGRRGARRRRPVAVVGPRPVRLDRSAPGGRSGRPPTRSC